MRAYVWTSADPVTDNWHSDGGLLIVAESLAKARAAWSEHVDGRLDSEAAVSEKPDHSWPIEAPPTVLVFPDSGCC
jgi:hypothetical protein